MEVPASANSNKPQPLPAVDPKYLLMAAAHMQDLGKISAYEPDAKFSDEELSKNLEDRRGETDMDRLARSIETTLAQRKAQTTTEGDVGYDTATPRSGMTGRTPR